MYAVCFLALSFLACVPLVICLQNGLIRFGRDYFFCLVYAQVLIYVHVAPAFACVEIPEKLQKYYCLLGGFCLLFFEIPFLWLYCRLASRFRSKVPKHFSPNRTVLIPLALLLMVSSLLFLFVSLEFEVFFKRVGPYSLRQKMADLDLTIGLFYRFYFKSALFLSAVFLYATLRAKTKLYKRFYGFSFGVIASTIALYDLVNNRLATLILIAYLLGLYWFLGASRKPFRLSFHKISVLVLGLGLGVFVVNNLRAAYYERGYWIWSDAFYVKTSDNQATDSLKWRLNGIDLMARLSPEWFNKPVMDIEAYQNSFLIGFGMVWGSAFSEERKDELNTAIKNHLMQRYLGWDMPDYYSCCLTDLYGCFNVLGLMLGALWYAYCLYFATHCLFYTPNPSLRLFGLFFMPFCLYFEHEFSNLLWGWLKTFPIVFLCMLIKPFRYV